jgi:esterase/lipase superfamily enzyme
MVKDEIFQQFALLDALLGNWDGIRVRMGTLAPALESELAQLAKQLGLAQEPGQIAVLIDKLLDLTQETAAYPYVRELIARSIIPPIEKTRGLIGAMAAEMFAASSLKKAAADFARMQTAEVGFLSVPILFATNRRAQPDPALKDPYAGEYSKELSYGRARITIPQTHRPGQIERPSWLGRESKESHVVFECVESLDRAAFATRLGKQIQRVERKELLIFLHGYRVTFEEAARRVAQVATDIQFGGVVILFSWPSAGALMGYAADEDCAAKSAEPLINFLRELENGPWSEVHLVAHSMGNRVMISGLDSPGLTLPLHHIVLVAADVDVDRFEQQFPRVRQLVRAERGGLITSYASNSDRALFISWWLHRSDRIGRFRDDPYVTDGMETIDATAVDSSLLGHSYFSDEPSVLTDLGLLVRENWPASKRRLINVARKWWAF